MARQQQPKNGAKPGPELPSPTFCILPWTHLFADELGTLYPCCFGLDAGTPNVDDEGKPFQVHARDGVQRSWNSGFMRQLRQDMTSGRRPGVCDMCFRYEDLGMLSYRQNANLELSHLIPEVATDLRSDGTAPLRLRSIDLRLGNRCNLRCRMCSPKSSLGLLAEWQALLGGDGARLDRFRHVDWYAQPEFWEGLERYTTEIETLTFAGGEPLLVSQHFDFLQRLADTDKASGISLFYITNGTVLPDGIAALWGKFKGVRLQISLDGYGAVNEFIRYPTVWDKLDRNLRYLDEGFAELNLTEINFNTTVQVYNILSLVELFEYTASFDRIKPYPNLSILNYPPCFSIQILPPSLKDEAVRRLRSFQDARRDRSPRAGSASARFREKVDGVIRHMLQADRQDRIPEFLQRTAVFDEHRMQRTSEVLVDLAPLFDHCAISAGGDTLSPQEASPGRVIALRPLTQIDTSETQAPDPAAFGPRRARYTEGWPVGSPREERFVAFGDSNILTFRYLHDQRGYEGWQPDSRNPTEDQLEFEPFTTVPMRWHTEGGRAFELFGFTGATCGGSPDFTNPFPSIRRILADREGHVTGIAIMLGQSELDFGLWLRLGKRDVDPQQYLEERFQQYGELLRQNIPPGLPTTLLGIHPPTVYDDTLLQALAYYGIHLTRFGVNGSEAAPRDVPWVGLEARVELRRSVNRLLAELANRHEYNYADITPEISDERGRLLQRYRLPGRPIDLHVNFFEVLPVWLAKLSAFHPGLTPARDTARP